MQSFEIETLPKVRFAHVYSVASYAHPLPPTKDCIEISLISEGELCRIGEDGSETVARKGFLCCVILRQREHCAGGAEFLGSELHIPRKAMLCDTVFITVDDGFSIL